MKKFFAQLRPLERRLAVGALVVLILVLNWVFIWPHFSDWSNLRHRLADAETKLTLYQTTISKGSDVDRLVKKLESGGNPVQPEDQSVNFLRAIQSQATASNVGIVNPGQSLTHTNEFFIELARNIDANGDDKELVDFLYNLGSDASMIRVRDLELQPDVPHQKLNARIRLVASYQRNAPAPPKTSNAKTK